MKVYFLATLLVLILFLADGGAWFWRRRRRRRAPTHCRWGAWGPYGPCSRSCGGGSQVRSRSIAQHAANGGSGCVGPSTQSRSCNIGCCPVSCVWGAWSPFGSCSAPCNGGTQTRSRSQQRTPSCGGSPCRGPATDSQSCNAQCCPVDCTWGNWGDFGDCSVTCGSGMQERTRSKSAASCGGSECSGSEKDTRSCDGPCCPVDCQYRDWNDWSICSHVCGGGTQERVRELIFSAECGGNCESSVESRPCNIGCCPVNCLWDDWSAYGECSETCGGGTQVRTRGNTPASCGGSDCSGLSEESKECNTQCCPVDCQYGDWNPWSECTLACGGGTQDRFREIVSEAICGGECSSSVESQSCNPECCPVDCVWSDWTEWDDCSATCGDGTQSRTRFVVSASDCGGTDCTGPDEQTQTCNDGCCPVDCVVSDWGEWSACELGCNEAETSTRMRSIISADECGGQECPVELSENRGCNTVCLNGGLYDDMTCQCPEGWTGECCEEDVDECLERTAECNRLAYCENTVGSYSCICISGYTGDGFDCTDVNECDENHNCPENTKCVDHIGEYSCVCEDGFEGSNANCQDIDECARGVHNCHSNSLCENTDGGFTCTCNAGYSGNGTHCIVAP